MEPGFYSYTFATASFSFLIFLLAFSRKNRHLTGDLLILACCVSALWGLATAASFLTTKDSPKAYYLIEFIRIICWIAFLLSILRPQTPEHLKSIIVTHLRVGHTRLIIIPLIILAWGLWLLSGYLSIEIPLKKDLILLMWISFTISGLLIKPNCA